MFVLKKNIQSVINRAQDKGFKAGCVHALQISDSEKAQLKDKYELEIMELKSENYIMGRRIDGVKKIDIAAREKDRMANEKLIQAQSIVLQVQQVLSNVSESAIRGGVDIQAIRDDIEIPISIIMEKNDV